MPKDIDIDAHIGRYRYLDIGMAYIGMAYIIMAYIVMSYVVMAYVV